MLTDTQLWFSRSLIIRKPLEIPLAAKHGMRNSLAPVHIKLFVHYKLASTSNKTHNSLHCNRKTRLWWPLAGEETYFRAKHFVHKAKLISRNGCTYHVIVWSYFLPKPDKTKFLEVLERRFNWNKLCFSKSTRPEKNSGLLLILWTVYMSALDI